MSVWIWGNGGHSKVVRRAYGLEITWLVDDANKDYPWVDKYKNYVGIIAIGNNRTRKMIADKLGPKQPYTCVTDCYASVRTNYGMIHNAGTFVGPACIVQVDTVLGRHLILNTAATIDHDCKIGDFAHIAPGAHLCGNVTVGEGTLVGAGTIVTPGVTIGSWLVIPAGSIVTKDCMNEDDVAALRRR